MDSIRVRFVLQDVVIDNYLIYCYKNTRELHSRDNDE